jgi:hypothetical protein
MKIQSMIFVCFFVMLAFLWFLINHFD